MSRADEMRLMTKIARMYYDQGIRQQEITGRLNIHQSTVSRLLKRARDINIVRISVAIPPGIFSETEEALEAKFGLREAIVVDAPDRDEERAVRDLGAAAAFFVESSVKPGMVIGISSWSRSLLAMVDSLHQCDCGRGGTVVQILGGIGSPDTQFQATQLAQDLALRIGATAVFLQAPGLVGSAAAGKVLNADPAVQRATKLFPRLDVALVGIGAVEPSKLLASSGNVFSPAERKELMNLGAVGDICLRYFNERGETVTSPLMDRVVGIGLDALAKAKRVVGIACGVRKVPAIYAALKGKRINVLITDRATADRVLKLK